MCLVLLIAFAFVPTTADDGLPTVVLLILGPKNQHLTSMSCVNGVENSRVHNLEQNVSYCDQRHISNPLWSMMVQPGGNVSRDVAR